jgi:hypothetical protein
LSVTLSHFTTPQFWQLYSTQPREIQQLADKNFELLKADASHSSLRLKKVGKHWSARVGAHYRVLATERAEGLVWFWIGPHAVYDALIR